MMGNMSGNKWSTWVTLGSILMMIVGGFKLIAGIIGLFKDQYLVPSTNGGYMLVDATGLAIWWLIVGAILLFGGMAALGGKSWGYVVGIMAASLAALSEFFSIPYTPIWSIIMIVVYVAVLAAFVNAPARSK
jgi:hypothetical protein